MQLKRWQVGFCVSKMKNGGKSPQNQLLPAQYRFKSEYSCIFHKAMNRSKYTHVVVWLKHAQVNLCDITSLCVP